MIIHRTGAKAWTNRHQTFTQPITDLYDLANENTGNPLDDYTDTTAGIQGLIREAVEKGRELRALGGEWSWTKVAATGGVLLNTKPLNLSFRINSALLSTSYSKTADDLYFAQCGVSVKELNDRLRKHNRSLKTTGASNGQTIVGAMSTGTHGSAIDIGSVQDFVVGMHIITGPSAQVWLERESYPVVAAAFAERLKTTVIRNDDLFNAALVSFGSFGFIHGVLLETNPLFLYEAYRLHGPADANLLQLMETLDFSQSTLPNGPERPYHFSVLINPYQKENNAYITAMYKRPFRPDYIPPQIAKPGLRPGDDAPAFIGKLTDVIPALVPVMVNNLVGTAYPAYGKTEGTHAEFFTNTDINGKVMSTAVGLPLSAVRHVTALLDELNKTEGPFAGVFAYRFVKGTKATLGFTRFDTTCILELDGAFSATTNRFYRQLWKALREEGIPHTFHWGKVFEGDAAQIRQMYQDKNVNAWLLARKMVITDEACRQVFTNELMRSWGLHKEDGIVV